MRLDKKRFIQSILDHAAQLKADGVTVTGKIQRLATARATLPLLCTHGHCGDGQNELANVVIAEYANVRQAIKEL